MDIFDAKLSFTVEKKIIHAGVISLFADIARLISLIYVNSAIYFYAIPMTCLFLTSLVLTFGLFHRFYESMIRGYEKPTVQELSNLNVLHVLNCKFNYTDMFDAKLSFTVEKKIIHAGVISLFVGDIPRLISLVFVNFSYIPGFSAIPMICFFLTILVITFGFFYRLYESMIRGYEKPTVQELI
ncbi:20745_t:CDS:2, partial [Rhizophagus irregularis]